MQIDSVKLHELLNRISLDFEKHHIATAIDCMQSVRRVLCDLEAETSCEKASIKYAGAIEGLKDK